MCLNIEYLPWAILNHSLVTPLGMRPWLVGPHWLQDPMDVQQIWITSGGGNRVETSRRFTEALKATMKPSWSVHNIFIILQLQRQLKSVSCTSYSRYLRQVARVATFFHFLTR